MNWKFEVLRKNGDGQMVMQHATIKLATGADRQAWDAYVNRHPHASAYHLFGWREIVRATYGHDPCYLMLVAANPAGINAGPGDRVSADDVLGVLPVFRVKSRLFGHSLVSMPFLDSGGVLADSGEVEAALVKELVRLGRESGADTIELRNERPGAASEKPAVRVSEAGKVRMLLELPESPEKLMQGFKSKLRSQINKPLKMGLTSRTGGEELLDDFYRVFLVNMRDLGSPVHSPELMRNVLREFPDSARIVVVYEASEPVAAGFLIGFAGMLRNPWASSLRKYAALSPNMLLYLRMLEFGCEHGYSFFDFGRSTKGEGTYRFKEQWGAKPAPLYWEHIALDGKSSHPEASRSTKFELATRCWRRLPVFVTKIIGPRIRKQISL